MYRTGTRLSLDAIKRRLQANRYAIGDDKSKDEGKPPLFRVDVVLEIPNVMIRPNLDELQSTLSKGVQIILKASQNMKAWDHQVLHQKQQQKVCHLLN